MLAKGSEYLIKIRRSLTSLIWKDEENIIHDFSERTGAQKINITNRKNSLLIRTKANTDSFRADSKLEK